MKHYKNKFYEVGNNRYYYLNADDELFIATESFIKLGNKNIFGKQKELTQGLKLLKVTSVLAILFQKLVECPVVKEDPDFPDMTEYEVLDNKYLKNWIRSYYEVFLQNQKINLQEYYSELMKHYEDNTKDSVELENIIEKLRKSFEDDIKVVNKNDPLNYIDLDYKKDSNIIITSMNKKNIKHLYSSKIDSFAKEIYLYDNDKFGTITIYKVITVKDVVKTIDTFIYDRKVIKAFLDAIENNDKRKEN